MRVLAVDTVSPAPSLALLLPGAAPEGGGPPVDVEPLGAAAAEELVRHVSTLLDRHGLRAADLERVAVVSGPGSFTGLRAGAAFARGLAVARGVPLAAVPTFVAAARALEPGTPLLALLDAGRGDVLASRLTPGGGADPEGGRLLRRGDAEALARAEGISVADLDRLALPLAAAAARLCAGGSRELPPLLEALSYGRPSAAEERFPPPCR